MVKVVGFPAPIDAAKLVPGSPFRFGDHETVLVVKAGVKTPTYARNVVFAGWPA
jgi:hypothetical protein